MYSSVSMCNIFICLNGYILIYLQSIHRSTNLPRLTSDDFVERSYLTDNYFTVKSQPKSQTKNIWYHFYTKIKKDHKSIQKVKQLNLIPLPLVR